jgi:hypothetical protein
MNEQERKFVDSAKRLLDESVTALDCATLSRLSQARNQALAGRGERKRLRRPFLMGGLAASVMTAVVLVLLVLVAPPKQEVAENNLVADLGLLTAEESIDFFEEIEFYEWLSAVEGEESDLACTSQCRPASGHNRPGAFPIPTGDEGRRDAGDRDAGVSRII